MADRFEAWNWKLSLLLATSGWFYGPIGLLSPQAVASANARHPSQVMSADKQVRLPGEAS